MIKDMARELRPSIEERETTSVWSHDLEEIHQDEDISQYIIHMLERTLEICGSDLIMIIYRTLKLFFN